MRRSRARAPVAVFSRAGGGRWPADVGPPRATSADTAEAVLRAASDLVAGGVELSLTEVEQVEQLIRSSTAEIAESFLAVEALTREQRGRLAQAAEVVTSALPPDLLEREAEAVEVLRFALEEQLEISTTLVQAVEERVSATMRALQFEDLSTQVLTGALARLARLAETFQSLTQAETSAEGSVVERIQRARRALDDDSGVPVQRDLRPGGGRVF